jgi:mRNA interferase RelE/StbE
MKVYLAHKAQKQLDRLNEPLLGHILRGLSGLTAEPPEGDIQPLKGQPGVYRLRIGEYRILFFEKENRINVFKIAPRGGAYRGRK